MKRFIAFLSVAFILLGCSSSANETNPVIEAYLLEHIANPDTYVPGKTEVIEQGTINVQNALNWHDVPAEGSIDVVVLRHEFSNVDNTGTPADNAFIFYMNPEMDVLYYAHKDKGFLLFPVE